MKISPTKAVLGTGLAGLSSIYMATDASAATYTGSAVTVPSFGYTVSVTISTDATGRIVSITTSAPPSGQNATYYGRAVPVLVSEALAAQSANINSVSGASAVSAAWKGSLASAIAQIAVTPVPSTPTPVSTPTQSGAQTPTTSQSGSQTSTGTGAAMPIPTAPGCSAAAPVISTEPEVTSAPFPQGMPSPYGMALPSGAPIPVSTVRGDNNRTTITQQQIYTQQVLQVWQQTVTKTVNKIQVVTCTPTATPTVYVTVTATPTLNIEPGAAVLKKTFVCSKTVNGVLLKKTLKASTVKCPLGYKLVKK